MKNVVYILFFFLASCGKMKSAGDETKPYFDSFTAAAKAQGVSLAVPTSSVSVYFETVPSGSKDPNAFCDSTGITPRLSLDNTFWLTASSEVRELLVFRSLGNCLLGRAYGASGIMNPNFDAAFLAAYLTQRDSYLAKLFNGT